MENNVSKEQTGSDSKKLSCRLYDGPLLPLIEKTDYYKGEGRLLVGESKYVLTPKYEEWQDRYDDFEVRPDDIFVCSLAKAGTTWTQEMVWCILKGLNHERAKDNLMKRFPFFEWDSLITHALEQSIEEYEQDDPCAPGATWKKLHDIKEHRLIKTHFAKELLPRQIWAKKNKIVYVCRDPRDVCVSYYYHYVKLEGFLGTLDDFIQIFLADLTYFTPFWPHLLGFWNMRNEENILFIRYEELKADLPFMIRKVAKFLGQNPSDKDVQLMAEHLTFDSMKTNKAVNNEHISAVATDKNTGMKFMRKGQVGDWKTHFDEATVERFRKWTEKNLKGSDFPYYRDY